MDNKDFIVKYFENLNLLINKFKFEYKLLENLVENLSDLRKSEGRLFFLGVGGSAANCSHAVNDFRKLCGIEAYAPMDNVSELTARINDEGWSESLLSWLKVSKLKKNDAIFIMSVGGGNLEKNVSVNIVKAIDFAKTKGTKIYGIVGRDGGYSKKVGDTVIVVPNIEDSLVTPFTESMHSVIWHCLVSHPKLKVNLTKW